MTRKRWRRWLAAHCMTAFVMTSRAAFFNIPDGTGVGISESVNLSFTQTFTTDVNVTLKITGRAPGTPAFNGDLYAYLEHNGETAILLNRPGRRAGSNFGYGDNGIDVTLDDDALNGDIHVYRFALSGNHSTVVSGPLTGDWAPDARFHDPDQVTVLTPQGAGLSVFNGTDPNGIWTLYVEDLSGGGLAKLESWSVNVTTAVPEPISSSAAAVLLLVAGMLWRRRRSG